MAVLIHPDALAPTCDECGAPVESDGTHYDAEGTFECPVSFRRFNDSVRAFFATEPIPAHPIRAGHLPGCSYGHGVCDCGRYPEGV